ncbi:hypothetical protein DCAR_0520236 [Daucus carota subsp. sativus]|uniref:Uncharacterized protein n=1 Tax=Daucus carota subsp. sativus TaxID=79200 RepID=A0A164YEY0_DAUCS|nr:hypothetical protein DCAR_0520236 [Daucus carota subsp. sativus]
MLIILGGAVNLHKAILNVLFWDLVIVPSTKRAITIGADLVCRFLLFLKKKRFLKCWPSNISQVQ